MKIAFLFGLVAGFAGLLAGAHFYPWVDPVRLPSETSVVSNGGRAERFVIRLPADRLVAGGNAGLGLRAAAFPKGVELPEGAANEPVLIEQFKLRDRSGDVVGIAARHWTRTEEGPAVAWLLLLPSRGALMLAAPGEAAGAVDAALDAAGRRAGTGWSGEVEVVAAEGDDARIVHGSEEFAGLGGHYEESWTVTGVGADGQLHGTITLDTITYRGS